MRRGAVNTQAGNRGLNRATPLRDSGIPWLGRVPAHWDVPALKFRYTVELGKMLDEKRITGNHLVPYLRNVDVQWDNINYQDLPLMDITEDEYARYTINENDVLVCEGGEVGRAAVVGPQAGVHGFQKALHRLRAESEHELPRFIFYALLWAVSTGVFSVEGLSTIAHLTADQLRRYRFPKPPMEEQIAIAAFLDWKAGQIDALIARKEGLLEKLKEKRLAVITQAVTRGLKPTAPLRDSGIPWIGHVPEHWEVKRVKFIARIGNGSTPSRENPLYWDDGYYPWLNSSVVNQEAVTMADQFVTADALKECHLPIVQPPAVLIGITGEGKTRGMATTLLFEATINQHLAYVKPDPVLVKVDFLRRVFDKAYSYLRSESDGGGSTKGAITCEQIAELPVPVPPVKEQAAIAAHLEIETQRMDRLSAKIEAAIDRLTEYRTALITAAMTGKIDVRGVKIPNPAT